MSKATASAKKASSLLSAPIQEPSEDSVRDYAYHLYEQGRCAPGHDVANWLEAAACLRANIPAYSSRNRLHLHAIGLGNGKPHAVSA